MKSHDVKLRKSEALCWPWGGISVTMPQTLKGTRGTGELKHSYTDKQFIEAKEGHQ